MQDRSVSSAPEPLGVLHSPVESVLSRAGATFIEHDGAMIASDFGSAAGELALLARGVGIADRADLGVLELSGHPGTLAHVVERVAGRPPAAGSAIRTAAAWWCPAGDRVLVVCERHARAALATDLDAAARRASGVRCEDVSDAHAAVSVVGPRSRRLLAVVARDGDAPDADGDCGEGELAGTPVLVVRESETQYLLVMASGDEPGEWDALLEAGRPLGVGYVGRDALEHYAVRARMLARRSPA